MKLPVLGGQGPYKVYRATNDDDDGDQYKSNILNTYPRYANRTSGGLLAETNCIQS
jgi:hypothetical protein